MKARATARASGTIEADMVDMTEASVIRGINAVTVEVSVVRKAGGEEEVVLRRRATMP
jgi:hypothetical protein